MCNHYESKRCDCLGGVCGLFQTSEDYYYNLAQQNSVTAVKEKHESVEKLRDELAELINKKELEYFEIIKTDYIHFALLDMKFEDLKIGQHLWVLANNELLMVAKFDEDGYEVCGAWECGIGKDRCEIIELVDVPKGHENTKKYYND